MTASNAANGARSSAPAATGLGPALSDLAEAALRFASAKASQKLENWADHLDDFVASGGAATQAAFEGLKAKLGGRNPVWAAIKGAWSGASPQLRLALTLLLLVTVLLSPVVLLVIVLGLLVAALVAGVRAAAR